MSSPIIDAGNGVGNTVTGSNSSSSSGSVSSIWGTSTTGAGLLVCIFSYDATSGSPTLTGVTAGGGTINLTLRDRIVNTTSGGHNTTIEVWTAPFTSGYNHGGSNLAIAWTASANYDDLCMIGFAVTGLYSTSAPFDSGAVPDAAFNSTSTTPPAVTFSTSQADDLLIYVSARSNGTNGTSAPSGWTLLATKTNGGGLNYGYLNVYYKSVSATQSSVSVVDASSTNDISWVSYVDAFTADNNNTTVDCAVTMTLFGPTISVEANDYTMGGPASVTMTLFNIEEVVHAGTGPTAAVTMTLGQLEEVTEAIVPAAPGTGPTSVTLTNG